MTNGSLQRYLNLFSNIKNWPRYFSQKSDQTFKPITFETRAGITFEVPTRELYLVFKEIFMTDFYSINDWAKSLPERPVIVDVGANAGYFSILMMSKRPDATIYAYEPIERNFTLFGENIKRNVAMTGHVHLFHRAVTGAPTDEITLYKEADSANSVTASVYKDFESHNLTAVKVKAISLSVILEANQLSRIDFLKLDCEGSEYPIVYESDQSVWKSINSVFLEVHDLDKEKRNYTFMNEFLQNMGYQTTAQLANNGCHALYAWR